MIAQGNSYAKLVWEAFIYQIEKGIGAMAGCLGLVHWDDPEGWYGEGGGRREEGSGWGTHVCLWRIHFDIWQNQYNIIKFKKKKRACSTGDNSDSDQQRRDQDPQRRGNWVETGFQPWFWHWL